MYFENLYTHLKVKDLQVGGPKRVFEAFSLQKGAFLNWTLCIIALSRMSFQQVSSLYQHSCTILSRYHMFAIKYNAKYQQDHEEYSIEF